MAVAVKIPVALRPATGGESEVTVEGGTVSEVLEALFERFGELRERISDEDGALRRFVNVYVAGEDIRFSRVSTRRSPTAQRSRSCRP